MLLYEDHRSQPAAVDHKADHKAVVYAVAFSPDGAALATGAKDGSLFVRDDAGRVASLRGRQAKSLAVHAIGHLPDGGGLIAGGEFGWATWRCDGDCWAQFGPTVERPVTSLAVVSDRVTAFGRPQTASSAGALELWDIAADRKLPNSIHEPNGVRAIAACPKKKLVAWVTGHRKLRLWDITSPTKPTDFPQKGTSPAVAISADGNALAVAVDWTAIVYDVSKRRPPLELRGHKGQVASVSFSPDGKTIMTGSWDQTVRLWDAVTGKERANYRWDIGRVYCATYAPDGLRLAAGGDLGRVVVWDAD